MNSTGRERARYSGAALLLVATLASAIGCGERVILGKTGGGGTGGSTGACAGKACGETCLFDTCAKEGSGVTCQAPAAAGYCDDAGECTLNQPLCTPWLPCDPASAKCGDPCWPCDPKSKACTPPESIYTCTDGFKCLPGQAMCTCVGVDCPATLPCAGLGCGDPCLCDPELNADCQTTLSPTFCDAPNGKCLPVEQVACPKGYQPCENKLCGQPCTICKPGDMNCKNQIMLVCDLAGECTTGPVSCGQPCTPTRCGQPCLPCNPEIDPTCVLPMTSYCDEFGGCRAGAATWCPCAGLSCGDACEFCDPDGTNCMDDMRQCDQSGACVPQPAPTCM